MVPTPPSPPDPGTPSLQQRTKYVRPRTLPSLLHSGSGPIDDPNGFEHRFGKLAGVEGDDGDTPTTRSTHSSRSRSRRRPSRQWIKEERHTITGDASEYGYFTGTDDSSPKAATATTPTLSFRHRKSLLLEEERVRCATLEAEDEERRRRRIEEKKAAKGERLTFLPDPLPPKGPTAAAVERLVKADKGYGKNDVEKALVKVTKRIRIPHPTSRRSIPRPATSYKRATAASLDFAGHRTESLLPAVRLTTRASPQNKGSEEMALAYLRSCARDLASRAHAMAEFGPATSMDGSGHGGQHQGSMNGSSHRRGSMDTSGSSRYKKEVGAAEGAATQTLSHLLPDKDRGTAAASVPSSQEERAQAKDQSYRTVELKATAIGKRGLAQLKGTTTPPTLPTYPAHVCQPISVTAPNAFNIPTTTPLIQNARPLAKAAAQWPTWSTFRSATTVK